MTKELLIKIALILSIIVLVLFIIYLFAKIHYLVNNKPKPVSSTTPSASPISTSTPPASNPSTPPCEKLECVTWGGVAHTSHSDFFTESINYALKVVKGESVCNEVGNENARAVLYSLKNLNINERTNIYREIESIVSQQSSEGKMRQLNEIHQMPIWILLIREAIINLANKSFSK